LKSDIIFPCHAMVLWSMLSAKTAKYEIMKFGGINEKRANVGAA